jgi:hypothetical protein
MKNSSDTIGNRTRDIPTCSEVPQQTAPPGAPKTKLELEYNHKHRNVLYWFLHYDNGPAHTALSVQLFLTKNKQHDGYHSSSLFTRPCAMRLFSVPSYEMPDEREMFY